MTTAETLIEAYSRIQQLVHASTEGLDAEALAYRPEPGSNSIAWLVWHLTRIQDDHLSTLAGVPQLWVAGGWAASFGLEPDPDRLGQGDGPDDVAAIRPDGATPLLAYHDAVMARTVVYLASVDEVELARIVDTNYTPHVTAGVRLVSVLSDNIQHAGQARYLRGMIERTR